MFVSTRLLKVALSRKTTLLNLNKNMCQKYACVNLVCQSGVSNSTSGDLGLVLSTVA